MQNDYKYRVNILKSSIVYHKNNSLPIIEVCCYNNQCWQITFKYNNYTDFNLDTKTKSTIINGYHSIITDRYQIFSDLALNSIMYLHFVLTNHKNHV